MSSTPGSSARGSIGIFPFHRKLFKCNTQRPFPWSAAAEPTCLWNLFINNNHSYIITHDGGQRLSAVSVERTLLDLAVLTEDTSLTDGYPQQSSPRNTRLPAWNPIRHAAKTRPAAARLRGGSTTSGSNPPSAGGREAVARRLNDGPWLCWHSRAEPAPGTRTGRHIPPRLTAHERGPEPVRVCSHRGMLRTLCGQRDGSRDGAEAVERTCSQVGDLSPSRGGRGEANV